MLADLLACFGDIIKFIKHLGVQIKDVNQWQLMAFAKLIVIKIMGRRDFDAPCTKVFFHISIRHNRHFTASNRQNNAFANQMGITLIIRVYRHRRIAKQSLWASGRHHQMVFAIGRF